MSRTRDLIDELCSHGVPFKKLGEIGELVRGNGMPRSNFTESGVGCIHYGQIYTYYKAWTTTTISFVPAEMARKLAKVDPGDLVITNTSENIDEVCKGVAWLGPEQIVTGGHATVLKHDQDPKFLSYVLQTPDFLAQKKKRATGTKVIDVSTKALATVRIPVPPLEIQHEIVKVLDRFTELEAGLESTLAAELAARRRQYEYYRRQLLAPGSARLASLGELFDMRAGRFISASAIVSSQDAEHPYPCFGGGGLRGYVAQQSHEGDLLLIGRQGALCGNVKRASGKFYATEHAVVATPQASVDVRWAFHQLDAMNLNQYASKSAQPGLAVGTIERVQVAVPSLEDQERIGSILDSLHSLVNDLSVDLPAEMRARRRQYEYYRDSLLTFREAVS